MRYISYLFWFLFLMVVVVFASANSQTVLLNYYISTIHVLLPVLMVLMVFLGFVVFLFAFVPVWFGVKNQNRKLHQKVLVLEKEIKHLRNIPIEDVL
jgi:uncharacterized membrane protein YciS (DUF1049 family)